MQKTTILDAILNPPQNKPTTQHTDHRLWSFQYPLIIQLANEGVPVDGVTIAAGVPSLEKSVEVLNALQAAGVQYVAFKPGSVAAIHLVTEIARNVPSMCCTLFQIELLIPKIL